MLSMPTSNRTGCGRAAHGGWRGAGDARVWPGSELTIGQPLVIGVRPEDIVISPGHGDGLDATVEVIESMGASNVVYVRLGDERIAITTGPTYTAAFDDPITLTLDPAKTLFFDPETENRVV